MSASRAVSFGAAFIATSMVAGIGSSPAAGVDDPELPWPDGDYEVYVQAWSAGAGETSEASGAAEVWGIGSFPLSLAQGRTTRDGLDFALLYWGSATGVTKDDVAGLTNASASILGRVFAEGGRVRLVGESAIVSLSDFMLEGALPVGGHLVTVPLEHSDYALIPRASSCGVIAGDYQGTLTTMIAAVNILGLSTISPEVDSRFVAVADSVTGLDPAGWMRAQRDIADRMNALVPRIADADETAQNANAAIFLGLVREAEDLLALFVSEQCRADGRFGLGLDEEVRRVLAAVAGATTLTPDALWWYVIGGARAGVLGSEAVNDPLSARVRELAGEDYSEDPEQLELLIFTAVTLRDFPLADELLERQ